MSTRITPGQIDAVRYADALTRGVFLPAPRRDVIGRAIAAGLLAAEPVYVHTGTTSRSRQRLDYRNLRPTAAGLAELAH